MVNIVIYFFKIRLDVSWGIVSFTPHVRNISRITIKKKGRGTPAVLSSEAY